MVQASGTEQGTSTRPYLLRALHDWCTDNGFTPYIAVHVDDTVQVPLEYVKNHEIVLNVGFEATSGLKLGNDFVEFKARFGGVAREIVVPIDHVIAIYARENGQGMAFPVPATPSQAGPRGDAEAVPPAGSAPEAPSPGRSPTPLRGGLRLAPRGAAEDPPPAAATGDAADSAPLDDDDPPPDGHSPAARPSLKRIK